MVGRSVFIQALNRLFIVFFRLGGLDLNFILPFRCLLEIGNTLAQSLGDFRDLSGAEHNQDENKDDDHFRYSETEHVKPPNLYDGGPVIPALRVARPDLLAVVWNPFGMSLWLLRRRQSNHHFEYIEAVTNVYCTVRRRYGVQKRRHVVT